MKQKIIIASYGGSGSTFLAKKVHQISPTAKVYHTHSVPVDGVIGVPTKNEFTGHDEGPLSNWIPLDQHTKTIVIVRNPAEAYLSRACFKHFAHIWYGTDRFRKILGNVANFDEGQTRFTEIWHEYIKNHKDILDLRKYLELWIDAIKLNQQKILFIKYEELTQNWQAVESFLEVNESDKDSINTEFSAKSREVSVNIAKLMEKATSLYESLPSVLETNDVTEDKLKVEKIDTNSTFTVTGLNAGFGDSFSRMDLVYRFLKQYSNLSFVLPEYQNYHSKNFDFFNFFQFSSESEKNPNSKVVELKFSQLIPLLIADKNFIENDTHYVIEADLYPGASELTFYPYISDENSLKNKAKLSVTDSVFSTNTGEFKIAIHLRRSDISKDYFLGVIDEEKLNGMHSRKLLQVSEAIEYLKNSFPKNSKLQVAVISDGVADLKVRFKDIPQAISVIEDIEEEIKRVPHDKNISYSFIIGKGESETLKTMSTIADADLVITRSSCFPNLLCELSGIKLVHL